MTLQPTPSGYSVLPFSSIPTKFRLFKTGDTSRYWCYGNNGDQVVYNTSPLLYMYADQPSDMYGGTTAVTNNWVRINQFGQTAGTYCFRHAGFVTHLNAWGGGNFDFTWRFYYLTGGDQSQVIIGNCYPADGIGYYIQDINDGYVAIRTQSYSSATVFTLVNDAAGITITSYSTSLLTITFNWTYTGSANQVVITWPNTNTYTSGTLTGTTYTATTGLQYNTSIQFTFTIYNSGTLVNTISNSYTISAGITITSTTNNGTAITITWSYSGAASKVIVSWPVSNTYNSGYITGTSYTASGSGITNNTTLTFTVTPYDVNNVQAGTAQTTSYFLFSSVRNNYTHFDNVTTTTFAATSAIYAAFRASTTYLGPTIRVQQFTTPASILQTITTIGTSTYTIPNNVYYIQVLLVGGGGGGGGGWEAGGGGGGGVLLVPFIAVQPGQVFTVIVGSGGTGGYTNNYATSGGNTSLIYTLSNISYTAYGGGRGGGEQNVIGPAAYGPTNGGSGGGGTWGYAIGNGNAVASPGGNGIIDQGYCGGSGYGPGYSGGGSPYVSGGGGGSGYPGQTPTSVILYGGNGGHAKTIYMAGNSYTYGGGGGGSCRANTNLSGMGGAGGGGQANGNGTGANASTYGGGGGGGGNNSGGGSGGNGYQGIVIIATVDTVDFYANANGDFGTDINANGTSLSTWLGNSTGYVVTVYDQSGNGNHAYQTSNIITNIPIINPSLKYIDFKPNRYFYTKNSIISQSNLSYTIITKINTHPTNTSNVVLLGNRNINTTLSITNFPSGGNITSINNKQIHTYTTVGTSTFTTPIDIIVDILIVGGGGGGGGSTGSGGGAGGLIYFTNYRIPAGTYNVTVGAGGPGGTIDQAAPSNGNNSSFSNLIALGGGGGGHGGGGRSGGSGGGGGGEGAGVGGGLDRGDIADDDRRLHRTDDRVGRPCANRRRHIDRQCGGQGCIAGSSSLADGDLAATGLQANDRGARDRTDGRRQRGVRERQTGTAGRRQRRAGPGRHGSNRRRRHTLHKRWTKRRSHKSRREAVHRRSVTQLTVLVVAPARDRAITPK